VFDSASFGVFLPLFASDLAFVGDFASFCALEANLGFDVPFSGSCPLRLIRQDGLETSF
jgi:hypothetical protein